MGYFISESEYGGLKIKWVRIVSWAVGLIAGLIILMNSGIMMVDTGHRGIKTMYGKVDMTEGSLGEGLHFYVPFAEDIVEMDVRVRRTDYTSDVYTKDIQKARIKYAINYHPIKDSIHKIYQEVGPDWEEKILPPALEGTLKNVIGKWEAADLIENRDKASIEILENLNKKLANEHINITNFEIQDIGYSDEFENAIEAKVTAIQRAIEEKNRTVQIEEQAKQKVIAAEAEAKKLRIQAQAIANSPKIIELEKIKVQEKALEKWKGDVPSMMMGGEVPFMPMINMNN